MRSLAKLTAYSMIVALAAALIVSCEDSALLAPTDGIFTVTASPENIVINEPGGETCDTATISAQIFDSGNYPMQGVEITFTTDGGTLLENDPGDDADCGVRYVDTNEGPANAGTATLSAETDIRGTAVVYLTITLDDADETNVTARSGTIAEPAVVTMSVTPENQPPEAFVSADPEDIQIIPRSVLFDGRSSADPDNDEITCWKWTISTDLVSDPPVPETMIYQGHGKSTVLETYREEQVLNVELMVSDDPGWAVFCEECEGPDTECGASDSAFGNPDFIIGYEIVCDRFDPVADAGPDLAQTLEIGQTEIEFTLDGRNSTGGDSGIVSYSWNCDGSTVPDSEAEITITFTEGTHNCTLTVTNGCGEDDSDRVVVTVRPAD